MFDCFERFRKHRVNFNAFFSTTIAILVSISLCALFIKMGLYSRSNPDVYVVSFIIAAIPVVTFLASYAPHKLRPAYYETWRDRYRARKDKRKILEQFARQYNIPNWKEKIDEIKIDKRWNFHANTKYMDLLAYERSVALNDLRRENAQKIEEINKKIFESEKAVGFAKIDLDDAGKKVIETDHLLRTAKSSGEVYKQRNDYRQATEHEKSCEKQLCDAEYNLEKDRETKKKIGEVYDKCFLDIVRFYNARYLKYMEIAIDKINKVNGLRYTVDGMPDMEVK